MKEESKNVPSGEDYYIKLDDLSSDVRERISLDNILTAVKRHFFNGILFECFDFRDMHEVDVDDVKEEITPETYNIIQSIAVTDRYSLIGAFWIYPQTNLKETLETQNLTEEEKKALQYIYNVTVDGNDNNTIFEKVNCTLLLSAEIVFHLEDSLIEVKDVFIIDKYDIEIIKKKLEIEKDCQK